MSNSTITARRKLLSLCTRAKLESAFDNEFRAWDKGRGELVDHLVANWSDEIEENITSEFGLLMDRARKVVQ